MRSRRYGAGLAAGFRGWAGLWLWCLAVVMFYGWPWLLPFPASLVVFIAWVIALAFTSARLRTPLARRPRRQVHELPRQRQPLRPEVKAAVWVRDGAACRHCGIRDEVCMAVFAQHLQFDHVVPWSLGGSDEEENIQLLCPPDNKEKGASLTWR